MTDELIQAYLWQEVIHKAFHPAGRDKYRWLLQYGHSLGDFWENDYLRMIPKTDNGKLVGSIYAPMDNHLTLEFLIESISKFAVTILYQPPGNIDQVMWIHDVDGKYLTFPSQALLSAYEQKQRAIDMFSTDPKDHMEKVVDGLLCHPMVHQHIKSPIDNHEIRVGGGIDNPFHFLFQIRFQLCPSMDRRADERNRLVELFTQVVTTNRAISVNELMMGN